MKLPKALLDGLNDELTRERYAEALYLSAAGQFETLNLSGFAAWCRRAAAEENTHARAFFDYLTDRNETPVLDKVDAVQAPDDITAIFQAALKQETVVSEAIRLLAQLSHETKDYFTVDFLNPFLKEQVKSERELIEIVGQLKLANGNPAAILLLNDKLGEAD